MPRKKSSENLPRKCITCGKMLPAGVRYCVSCGTHDETDLDVRIADLDRQVERSRERNHLLLLLSRLTFGFWRF
jgi:hypothetical protein